MSIGGSAQEEAVYTLARLVHSYVMVSTSVFSAGKIVRLTLKLGLGSA